MKKAIALILVVILTVALTACGTDDKLVGTWKLADSGTYLRQIAAEGGVSYEDTLLALSYLGIKPEDTWIMVFNKDGTGEMTVMGETMSIKYSTSLGKVTITMDGEKSASKYKIEGDSLTLTDDDGTSMKFKKK